MSGGLEIYSTCPESADYSGRDYLDRVREVAEWSEEAGCRGILIYTDNRLVDPWQVASVVIGATRALCPLIAVQPIYMHPYWVAKEVATLAHLYGRRVVLNMLAGGFKLDLEALGDPTPHDERYERLVEYTRIIQGLAAPRNGSGVSVDGRWYKVTNLKLAPPVPPELAPGILLSGSSAAGLAAATALDAIAIHYPGPSADYLGHVLPQPPARGLRVGIIARDHDDEAWAVAEKRFPLDRRGQIAHGLAMKVSDSSWHRQLTDEAAAQQDARPDGPYWLRPFANYQTFCPYLVGTHAAVAAELQKYLQVGFKTVILDIPPNREEIEHIGQVFQGVEAAAA